MSDKYGFGAEGASGIELPKGRAKSRKKVDRAVLDEALDAGKDLGFVDREPQNRRKPGPKRKEPQDKVSIPGPKRVTDRFRKFCADQDITLWQGLEMLLENRSR